MREFVLQNVEVLQPEEYANIENLVWAHYRTVSSAPSVRDAAEMMSARLYDDRVYEKSMKGEESPVEEEEEEDESQL
jgi:hypothetical protein